MCCKRDTNLWKENNIMATNFLLTFCNSSYVDAPELVKNVLQKRRTSLNRDLYYCCYAWRNIHTSVDRSKIKMVLPKRHISLKRDLYYGHHFLRNRVIHARIIPNLRRCSNCDMHLWKDTHTHKHTHTHILLLKETHARDIHLWKETCFIGTRLAYVWHINIGY